MERFTGHELQDLNVHMRQRAAQAEKQRQEQGGY
jgi:hypothetical protein